MEGGPGSHGIIHIHLFMMAADLTASPVKARRGMKIQHKDSNSSCLHGKIQVEREKQRRARGCKSAENQHLREFMCII